MNLCIISVCILLIQSTVRLYLSPLATSHVSRVVALCLCRTPKRKKSNRTACFAVQRWGLRCRYDFSNLSAVRFVYRYVI